MNNTIETPKAQGANKAKGTKKAGNKVSEAKPAQVFTHKQKLAVNKATKLEGATLGHVLSMLEKGSGQVEQTDAFRAFIKGLRKDSDTYKAFAANCPTNKAGMFTYWGVLGAIQKALNTKVGK